MMVQVKRPRLHVTPAVRDAQCLRAAARREQLQAAYRAWVRTGRRRSGPEMAWLQIAAAAHMRAAMCAGL